MAGRNTVEIILSASDRASGALRGAFGSIENSSSKAMGVIKAGAAIAVGAMAALGGVVSKVGVDYNAMMEQSQIAWGTILGSQEEAKKTLKELQQMGAKTPYEFEGLDKSAKLLEMAGFKGKDLFNTLTKVGDAVSAVGGNDEVLQGVAMALYQMSAKGKISAQEMNQMAERGIPAWQMLADGMHKSVPELMKMSEQGKLFAKDAVPMMVDAMGNKFKGSMDAQSKTFNGMVSTMKDNLKILAGELSKPLFEKMKEGLKVVLPMIDGLTSLAQGDFKGFSDIMQKTFGSQVGGMIVNFASNIDKGMNLVKGALDKGKKIVSAFYNAFMSVWYDTGEVPDLLAKIGIGTEQSKQVELFFKGTISTFNKAVGTIKSIVGGMSAFFVGYINTVKTAFSGNNAIGSSFAKIFNTAKSIVIPILTDIVSFIKDKLGEIKKFWDENGAQIIRAVKNFWAVVAAIFKALAPVILFIIKMVWDSIKGVIDGALKIIMGLIKVFAGLFTGDFGKMWEGIKQLFFGAIEFIWNLINLLMFGRILGGIKSFATKGVELFKNLWTKSVEIFKNLDTHVWGIVRGFVSKIIGSFSNLYSQGARIFGTLRSFGASIFQSLGNAISSVVSTIYSNVVGRFSSMVSGVRGHFSSLLSSASSIFQNIKNAITNPIETAKNLVERAINAIKGFFRGMKVKIPLPHFDFSLGHKDIGGVSIPYPKMDVDWYDKGGVFYSPQIIGVGEKRPEIVGALDDFRKIVREESGSNGKGGNTYHITVNKEDTANQLVRELQRLEWLHG